MLLCARSSSELPLAQVTALLTSMLPLPAWALVVSTMTLLLASAACSVVTFRFELAALPVKVGPALTAAVGRRRDRDVARVEQQRARAAVPGGGVDASRELERLLAGDLHPPAEPARSPPLAEIVPANEVASSAQTITLPPAPLSVASARRLDPAATALVRALATAPGT